MLRNALTGEKNNRNNRPEVTTLNQDLTESGGSVNDYGDDHGGRWGCSSQPACSDLPATLRVAM